MDLSLPRGIRDIESQEHLLYERIREAFYEVADLFNFKMMEPAPIEYLSTLSAKSGEEVAKQIYSFKDKRGRDVGLRFDLTVGLTRYVSSRRDLKPPIKLACYGGAWRYEEPQYGRYRWFHQWDVEIFGSASAEADVEVIDVCDKILRRLELDNLLIQIGERSVVEEYIRKSLRVSSEEKLIELMRALDKVQRKTEEELIKEYEARGVGKDDVSKLLEFGRLHGPPEKMIQVVDELQLKSSEGLGRVWDSLKSRGIANVEYNMSVVRGIDYYTGLVFETVDTRNPQLGSLCGGGRYDLLPKVFGRPDLSATGAAGGIERVALLMKGRAEPRGVVFVAYTDSSLRKNAVKLASELRSEGVKAETALDPKSLGKQLEDASDLGAKWTVIIGKRELASGELTLRDMNERNEERLSPEEVRGRLKAG
ncbi:MAG: histidine--tRNA ligase [Thaumarchaeota archaeon]|nr:MAG: histidine--tRNA ligase [Nitrososphaerota archaeon]TLX99664.1 MAG: histidine--tRNA ligase [Nitrososphaerota archaeon]